MRCKLNFAFFWPALNADGNVQVAKQILISLGFDQNLLEKAFVGSGLSVRWLPGRSGAGDLLFYGGRKRR